MADAKPVLGSNSTLTSLTCTFRSTSFWIQSWTIVVLIQPLALGVCLTRERSPWLYSKTLTKSPAITFRGLPSALYSFRILPTTEFIVCVVCHKHYQTVIMVGQVPKKLGFQIISPNFPHLNTHNQYQWGKRRRNFVQFYFIYLFII